MNSSTGRFLVLLTQYVSHSEYIGQHQLELSLRLDLSTVLERKLSIKDVMKLYKHYQSKTQTIIPIVGINY